MPSGSKPGERRGGREKGTRNRVNLQRAKMAQQTGILPADVLLEVMRYHHGRAVEERRKPRPRIDKVAEDYALAKDAAKEAAPYYHQRLATLTSNVKISGRLTLEDLIQASLPSPANDDTMKLIEGEVTESVEIKHDSSD